MRNSSALPLFVIDFLRNFTYLLKLPFLTSLSSNLSTIYTYMLSKFVDKSVQKSSFFSCKANYARSLIYLITIFSLHPSTNLFSSYSYNTLVPQKTWEIAMPYFLPYQDPQRKNLDNIFSKVRATISPQTMKKEGFSLVARQEKKIFVAKHPQLKNILVKGFYDEVGGRQGVDRLITRIVNAIEIRDYINRHNMQDWFDVPEKFIYPLPQFPSVPDSMQESRKNFLLIVRDMDLASDEEIRDYYKNKVTKKILKKLFRITRDLGLSDSYSPLANIPVSKEGKICFVDTQRNKSTNIHNHFDKVLRYLSNENKAYWQGMMDEYNKTLE